MDGTRELVRVSGQLTLIHQKADGSVARIVKTNMVLDDGLQIFADRIGDTSGPQPKLQIIAIGDDDTAPTAADVDLAGTELPTGRKATTNTTPSAGRERFTATFVGGEATGTWKEAVLADTNAAAGARKCACRATFGAITKAVGDTIITIWEIQFARV